MARSKIVFQRLSDTEFITYLACLLSILCYGICIMVKESSSLKNIYFGSNNIFGINLTRDNTDFEWDNYLDNMLTYGNVLYLLFIPFLDYLAKKLLPQAYREIMFLYSIILFIKFFTIYGLLFAFVTSVGFYYLAKLKYKSAIWIATILVMYCMHEDFFVDFMGPRVNGFKNKSYNDYIILFYFSILRIISFCLDKINFTLKKDTNRLSAYDFKNFLSYIFYPTFLTYAPFISFERFLACHGTNKGRSIQEDLKVSLKYFIRIVFSIFLIEMVLRLTLTYTLVAYHRQIFSDFTVIPVVFALVLRGSLFSCKYIVYYGFPTLLNKLVGMRVGELPRCIWVMHTNSELWRYFDTGLHEFIKNYLYIPLGGNKNFQLISLLFSFGFVSYWHGYGINIAIWTAVNCSMIISELYYSNYFLKQKLVNKFISGLSPWKKRFIVCSILSIWQMIMYINASFFFDSMECTLSFFKEMLFHKDLFFYFPIALFCFYCNAQLRLEFVDLFI